MKHLRLGPDGSGDGGSHDPVLHQYRLLALRVIHLALRDARGFGSATDKETARSFLAGSSLLSFWCTLASLDAGAVRRSAEDPATHLPASLLLKEHE